jgi:hypothetical protein
VLEDPRFGQRTVKRLLRLTVHHYAGPYRNGRDF